jgi:hypothetical protein
MGNPDIGYDFERYRKLLAEADDEPKRLALIDLLIEEKARDRLARQVLRTRLSVLGITSEPYVQKPASMEKNLHRDPL